MTSTDSLKIIDFYVTKYVSNKQGQIRHMKPAQTKQTKTIVLLNYYNNQFCEYMSRLNRRYRHILPLLT